jgi:serine/threonine-protein kinase
VPIAPGTHIERYEVHGTIGAGAMGEVYLAIDTTLGRRVALKILSEAHRDNAELRARFVREARAVAGISHPNVVQVFTTGEFDGRPYFAMEYLAGRDLGSIVREGGPLAPRVAAGNLLDAARGLEAAAAAGIIHRDVKPSNLVRLDSGPVKVTDFGLAKPAKPTGDPALTALGVVVGTPDYIAPEQARGDEIDYRVDVYSLGCTLFYLLVGKAPYRRGNDDDDKYLKVVARHIREPAPDARSVRPGVDDELADLALAMMHKSPDARPGYPDIVDRLEDVRGRLARRPSSAIVQPAPAAPPPPPTRPLEATPRPPSNLWLWLVSLASMAVLAAGLGLTVLGGRRSATAALPPDAGTAVPDAPARARPPEAPAPAPAVDPHAGMLAVARASGKALWVDRLPVANRAYAELTRGHRYAPEDADKPVVGVSFEAARAYARARGRRLLRPDEWPAARDTLGFIPAGMRIWEWVDDGAPGAKERPVWRVPDERARKKAAGERDVTFRLALDG